MPTQSLSRDRGRVSSQKHEITYAGKKVLGGSSAVLKVKKTLGRTTARAKVMAKARSSK